MEKQLKELEKNIEYQFKNKELLKQATTHSSLSNQTKEQSNERLEFLGDSILGFLIAERLYNDNSQSKEGNLTKLRQSIVNNKNLSEIAKDNKLDKYLKVAPKTDGNNIFGDMIEAIIGAIYLDAGIEQARIFVNKFIPTKEKFVSYKTLINEEKTLHNKKKDYNMIDEDGKDNEKVFTMALYIDSQMVAKAQGSSKEQAGEECARIYWESINNKI